MSNEDVKIILDLNDDCLTKIFKDFFSSIELCAVAETCKRFQCIAREVFRSKWKSYTIPGRHGDFGDHQRILKNFGDIVTSFNCITRMFGVGISGRQMKMAFEWAEKYCGEALQEVIVASAEELLVPESAIGLMAKVRHIKIMAPISDKNLGAVLMNSKKLVDLELMMYSGLFHFPDHRLPHLRTLSNRVQLGPRNDYKQIEKFFKHHSALTELNTQFLDGPGSDTVINLSFLKHLTNLTKLNLTLCNVKIVGVDAFTKLNNLQVLSICGSGDERIDVAILENLASVDSLVELSLGYPDVSHLITGIGRFKNLSKLEISDGHLGFYDQFPRANIESLSQLSNSSCKELKVSCSELLEPQTLVNVVRSLKEVKKIELFCEVALSKDICKRLAKVCATQKRKIEIILEKVSIDNMNFDFTFIDGFNKSFSAFVEIKIKL